MPHCGRVASVAGSNARARRPLAAWPLHNAAAAARPRPCLRGRLPHPISVGGRGRLPPARAPERAEFGRQLRILGWPALPISTGPAGVRRRHVGPRRCMPVGGGQGSAAHRRSFLHRKAKLGPVGHCAGLQLVRSPRINQPPATASIVETPRLAGDLVMVCSRLLA